MGMFCLVCQMNHESCGRGQEVSDKESEDPNRNVVSCTEDKLEICLWCYFLSLVPRRPLFLCSGQCESRGRWMLWDKSVTQWSVCAIAPSALWDHKSALWHSADTTHTSWKKTGNIPQTLPRDVKDIILWAEHTGLWFYKLYRLRGLVKPDQGWQQIKVFLYIWICGIVELLVSIPNVN